MLHRYFHGCGVQSSMVIRENLLYINEICEKQNLISMSHNEQVLGGGWSGCVSTNLCNH